MSDKNITDISMGDRNDSEIQMRLLENRNTLHKLADDLTDKDSIICFVTKRSSESSKQVENIGIVQICPNHIPAQLISLGELTQFLGKILGEYCHDSTL